jgi:cytoskeletal protein CcmA (bactofilin family)
MSNKTPYIQQYPSSFKDGEQTNSTAPPELNLSPTPTTPTTVSVAVGAALPSSASLNLPTLKTQSSSAAISDLAGEGQSLIAEGVNFVGNAQLSGVCSVGGKVEGNLVQSPGFSITVIVTESGYVKGDIVASNISIMGQTDGLLDATGGSVTLHDASQVSGHVRYNRLQVNGADLNATLEKASGSSGHSTTRNVGSGL